ncbi:AraC family transcriptional regulator [Streptomyces sp. NBC_01515]|uniref:AraC family transcriptional regulator n=1 Tax=Streptomyces sp. NBC_01515 TaxID=2903890 RepID=UPI00386E21A8
MRDVMIHLSEPPAVPGLGVGVHGLTSSHDVYCLPELWQLHLYGYTGEFTVGGTTHAIRPGLVSLIPPGTEVRYAYRGRSEHLYAHLRIQQTGQPHAVPVAQDTGDDAALLSSLLRAAITAHPSTPARAVAAVWTALWHIAERPSPHPFPGHPHPAVSAAAAHIEEHLAVPLTVPAIARVAGISPNHLTRLFRAGTGDTVVAYIRRRRMDRARHLLRATTLSIPAVAAAVGIPDLQAFNKTCRRELDE